jgi:hypothetical protein
MNRVFDYSQSREVSPKISVTKRSFRPKQVTAKPVVHEKPWNPYLTSGNNWAQYDDENAAIKYQSQLSPSQKEENTSGDIQTFNKSRTPRNTDTSRQGPSGVAQGSFKKTEITKITSKNLYQKTQDEIRAMATLAK